MEGRKIPRKILDYHPKLKSEAKMQQNLCVYRIPYRGHENLTGEQLNAYCLSISLLHYQINSEDPKIKKT